MAERRHARGQGEETAEAQTETPAELLVLIQETIQVLTMMLARMDHHDDPLLQEAAVALEALREQAGMPPV